MARIVKASRLNPACKDKLRRGLCRIWMTSLLFITIAYSSQTNAFCWNEAAARYNINASVLQSIGQHESGLKPTAINRNNNGTVDVGVMQINSIHFAELQSYGIVPSALWEPCTNVMVGAFLLAKSIKKYGNTWEAVGAYHSRTPTLKERYALQVYRVFSTQEKRTTIVRTQPVPPTRNRASALNR